MTIQPKLSVRLIMIAIIVGLIVGDLINFDLNRIWLIIIAMAFSCVVVAITLPEKWVIACSIIGIALLGAAVYSDWQKDYWRPNDQIKNQTAVTGIVDERPALTDKQQLVLLIQNQQSHYKVLVNLPRYPEYHYGDKLTASGKLEDPVVFPDFNYRNYLKGRQIYLVINRVDKIENSGFAGSKFKRVLYDIAGNFESALNRSLPEPEASFAAGLLLGSKRGLPDSLVSSMQTTGTSHLVAISGYNVTIIASVLVLLFLPFGRRFGFGLVAMTIISFVILTGASASVVRGGIMALLILFAEVVDRRANQTNILLLAAILIAIFNPLQLLYDTGFQLSFAAFAGLIYIGPVFNKFLAKKEKIPEVVRGTLAETLSAQVFTLPILLFSVGKFSLIAPLPNVLILPLVPLAMLLSLITGIFGMMTTFLGRAAGFVSWLFLTYPIKVIDWFSKIPLASYNLKQGNLWLAIGLYILIIIIALRFSKVLKNVKNY
jgi:competence protein ComEC